MDANTYQDGASRTICMQEPALIRLRQDGMVQLLHSIVGLMGELGELATALERHVWYGQPLDRINMREEMGDAAWYLAEGCSALEERFGEVLERNLDKLRARYPEKYTDRGAAERDLARERTALTGGGQDGHGWNEPEDCE